MGGVEACRQILSASHGAVIPRIAFLTAHATAEHKATCMAAGGKDFLTKPFNLQKLETFFQSLSYVKFAALNDSSMEDPSDCVGNPQTSDGACMLPGLECVPSEAMLFDCK